MIQLAHGWLLAVFFQQVVAVVLVAPFQGAVANGIDRHDARPAVMERCRRHELVTNFVALGTLQGNIREEVPGTLGLPAGVGTPTRMCEAEVLPAAVARDELGAFLLW